MSVNLFSCKKITQRVHKGIIDNTINIYKLLIFVSDKIIDILNKGFGNKGQCDC